MPHSPYDLSGRVAVVTGAAGAIGSAMAEHLASLGVTTALLDLPSTLPRLQAMAQQFGQGCLAVGCDITDASSVDQAADAVKRELGRVDILVNNAAFLPPNSSLQDLQSSNWVRAMSINVQGALHCTQSFGRHMIHAGKGCIINIGSVASHQPSASPAYSVSKAAILALTRHTAVEWGPRGIRTNSVSPGFVHTAMSAALYADQAQLQRRTNLVPLRRLATPLDIAQVVAYMASDAASYINGQDLLVDGGVLETALHHSQPIADQYGGYQP